MHKGLFGFLFISLLGVGITGCSRDAVTPAQTQQDNFPQFWHDAETHVSFAGSSSNLTLIARYIGEGMYRRLGPGFVWAVYGARGHAYYEGLVAAGEGEVDFALTTPPVTAKLAMEGKGYFQKAYPNLRAIAAYPQNDWLACAVLEELGVSSFEDIKARQLPLKIATGPIGATDGVGFLTERLLEAYGIDKESLEAWGGEFLEARSAPQAVEKVLSGEANVVCHEYWKAFYPLTDKVSVKFLPVSDEVLDRLSQEFGYQRNVIPKGIYKTNVPDRDIPAVDFSDWVVLVDGRVSDDLAYLAAKVAVEDRAGYEIFYAAQTERNRSLDTPMKPEEMWKNVGVPLHPGAERYYRESGLMQ